MTEQNDFETIKFLIETISSIKTSLGSIEKDTSRKAANIQNISEQLIIIIDALKKSNDHNTHSNELMSQKLEILVRAIDELKSRLDVVEARNDFISESIGTLSQIVGEINIKTEVSAEALANIERYVVDSKDMLLEFKVRNSLKAARVANLPKDSTFKNAIEFVKNLDNVYKTILAIALFFALFATVFLKSSLTETIVGIIKGMF